MSHDDGTWDQGHGEPGHVHDENWNPKMMATDGTAVENEESGNEALGAGAGALGGAAVGMAVGGPPGAVVGGAVGAAGGAGVGDQAEEEAEEVSSTDYVETRRV